MEPTNRSHPLVPTLVLDDRLALRVEFLLKTDGGYPKTLQKCGGYLIL